MPGGIILDTEQMNSMLTAKQQKILDFIREGLVRGSAPSVREIARHFRFASPNAVISHLRLLEQKGVIRRQAGRSRNIQLAGGNAVPSLRAIPLLGAIPAGLPVEEQERAGEFLHLDPAAFGLSATARTFALKARGDSMTGAGIYDGDTVILEVTEARHRDIVAALIDGASTLKRLIIQNGESFLKAENPKYEDLLPARELLIQGVFRGLLSPNRQRL